MGRVACVFVIATCRQLNVGGRGMSAEDKCSMHFANLEADCPHRAGRGHQAKPRPQLAPTYRSL